MERIPMEVDQHSMQQQQQQQPIQYINVDHDSGHSSSNNENTFAPDNNQDNPSMAIDQQYTNEMTQMNDINQQMQHQQQQQHHVIHDDQSAAQNLINEVRLQPTLCESEI